MRRQEVLALIGVLAGLLPRPGGAQRRAVPLIGLLLPGSAEDSGPDAIFVIGNLGTSMLHEATHTVPVVFENVTDPVGAGLVSSLARPGGNITGFANFNYGEPDHGI